MYRSPCLLLTYRSPYDENCRRKQFTDAVHTVVSMVTIGGKPTHRNVQIDRLVSLIKIGCESDRFIYLRRRLPANLFTAAVHSCLWWKLVRSAATDSRNGNWCSKRRFPEMNRSPFWNCEEREKKPSLSSPLRNSLSAMSPPRCSLALSRRKISRKTSGTRIVVNHFADDLKLIEQVVHRGGQGHSHRRFRGRLCSSLTACRTTKVVLRAFADLQVVHVDGQDHSHRRLRGRLCISLTACTHRSTRMTT